MAEILEPALLVEDKEILRRKLELLQREYERTAQKLQRAERREAVRRHVRSKISEQNQPTEQNPATPLSSSAASFASHRQPTSLSLSTQTNPDADGLPDSPNLQGSGLARRVSAVRFHLPERADESPEPSSESLRSSAHRLRSRRSRLRLQNRERASDTESSQEKERDRWRHRQFNAQSGQTDGESRLDSDVQKLIASQSAGVAQVTNQTREELKESSQAEEDKKNIDHVASLDVKQQKELTDAQCLLGAGNVLHTCTVIEGLPFPVEYYIRTTRRMAAAQSSVDLDAVIQSQLTGGRGRRRSSQSQTPGRSQVTSGSSESENKPVKPRGRGQRGKRGRGGRRSRGVAMKMRVSQDFTAPDTEGECGLEPLPHSQLPLDSQTVSDSESFHQSESLLEKGPLPHSASISQPKPVPSSGPDLHCEVIPQSVLTTDTRLCPDTKLTPNPNVFPDTKHLTDSQLLLDTDLLSDANVYPIFRTRAGKRIGDISYSQTQATKNGSTSVHSSLASLTQALMAKDSRSLGQLLTTFDLQDFYLPDEEFGRLKLEKLRFSTSGTEPFSPNPCYYNTRHGNKRYGNRTPGNRYRGVTNSKENNWVSPQPLPFSPSPQDSLPLCQLNQSDQSQAETKKTDQSENRPDTTDQSQTSDADPVVDMKQSQGEDQTKDKKETQTQTTDKKWVATYKSPKHPWDSSELPVSLNLSRSQASQTQTSHDLILPSLGMTPHLSTPHSPFHPLFLLSPSDSQETKSQNRDPETETQSSGKSDKKIQINSEQEIQTCNQTHMESRTAQGLVDSDWLTDCPAVTLSSSANPAAPTNQRAESKATPVPNGSPNANQIYTDGSKVTRDPAHNLTQTGQGHLSNNREEHHTEPSLHNVSCEMRTETGNATPLSVKATLSSSVLQRTHTLKAMTDGCIVDVCVVRWPSEELCVCVAGEWSVCVWAQRKSVEEWSLLHTWTFTQPVVSLITVPDSAGLVCVTFGQLEITEARVLCCPGVEGPFSLSELSMGALQTVVGVSDCRLVFSSASQDNKQRVNTVTLTPDGRVAESLALDCPDWSVQNLAAVEGQRDALIGWTEHRTLLLWNLRTGQLLLTVQLGKMVSMAMCMRGYSYRGALCVLLQSVSVCNEEKDSALFSLIALNPLTGKSILLASITSPTSHTERLVDGDVSGAALVGVFQSGSLAVWDLGRGVAHVIDGGAQGVCNLARWAGPNTLLTGHLNGDINVYQHIPA
ncbi:partner and localizer of BRCA2 [Chanos chanos]|uniref:Partner and localizer of BRCA2 n=1 Tax=Chanos chanos TaxID=29144 RepID=A0A6J2VS65_CHACN|nr:partner and localizer of BRCA2 [Chanos chanos]